MGERARIIGTGAAVAAACALLAVPASADPVPLLDFGSSGTGAGELGAPTDAALDAAGNVYVGDTNNHRIDVFDGSGNFLRAFGLGVDTGAAGFEVCTAASGCQFGTSSGAAGDAGSPDALAIDSAGHLFATDQVSNRINVFDISSSTPAFVMGFGWGAATGAPQFQVCTTTCQGDFPPAGPEAGRFYYPMGLAIDGFGRLYVGDQRNHRVAIINAAGSAPSYAGAFGWDVIPGPPAQFEVCTSSCQAGQGTAGNPGQLEDPSGLALDDAGRLFVADTFHDRIATFDVSGSPSPTGAFGWGVATGTAQFEVCTTSCQQGFIGGAAGQLYGPWDVGLDGSGNLFVTDQLNHRISVFNVSGTPSFIRAYGWDVIPANAVTDYEVCTTGTGCKAGVFGSGSGQLNAPNGLGVDCRGAVWVPNHDEVQRFGEPGTESPPCTSSQGPPGGGAASDTTPPNTKLGKHPKKRTRKRRAKFTFISTEPSSSFKCKLDKKPFRPCRSPFVKKVKPGKHRFKVEAIDTAGNVDPSPAAFKWKVLAP
jgi:NHL repeat